MVSVPIQSQWLIRSTTPYLIPLIPRTYTLVPLRLPLHPLEKVILTSIFQNDTWLPLSAFVARVRTRLIEMIRSDNQVPTEDVKTIDANVALEIATLLLMKKHSEDLLERPRKVGLAWCLPSESRQHTGAQADYDKGIVHITIPNTDHSKSALVRLQSAGYIWVANVCQSVERPKTMMPCTVIQEMTNAMFRMFNTDTIYNLIPRRE